MFNRSVLRFIAVLLSALVIICSILLILSEIGTTEVSKVTDSSGYKCVYEGVSYNVGDALPTYSKCWDCVCCEGFTEPNELFCTAIECLPRPSAECEIVHEEGTCCPTYHNCTNNKVSPSTVVITTPVTKLDRCHNCDQRYFKHYETKQCHPVFDDGCECPKGFNCPGLPAAENTTVCKYKGKTYYEGERILVANPCRACRCRQDRSTSTLDILCTAMTCGYMPGAPVDQKECYNVYEDGHCCPSTIKCSANSTLDSSGQIEPTCKFEGTTYRLGQRMYSAEDPCLICLCDKDFHSKNSSSCHLRDCDLERKMSMLRDGCVPIYYEKGCCPIGFHCPNDSDGINPTLPTEYVAFNQSDQLSHCIFNEQSFSIGNEIKIAHLRNCVTCTCITPPDFTCIYKDC